jgi:hypothetical protein
VNPVRRFSDALREMRWAQVVLELALLVLGILIALAVNGWMDDRRDARAERQYLELLVRDLDRDLGMLVEVVAYEERQVEDGILAYRALRSSVAPADREAVAGALTRLTSRRTLRLTRATYTDLLGTGNLRLVRNAALRDRIVGLYETNERTVVIRDRNNEVFVDQMYLQYLLGSGLIAPRPSHNLLTPMQEFAERVAVPVDARSDRLWRLPDDDPERLVLANKVWFRSFVSQAAIAQTQTMTEEIRSVRDEITAELARRWPRQP